MRLTEDLARLRTRAEKAADPVAPTLLTEEATKTALVMPMLRALGYDVFDPDVVIPEFVADVGIKKGEKVDYALRINGDIAVLIECKPVSSDLSKEHAAQLYRYFSVTKARFSILTNGIEWRFFSDLAAANKMDDKPFFIFSLLDYDDYDLVELQKFAPDKFSVEDILNAANDLKDKSLIADEVRREFAQPSDEFTKLIARRVYPGLLTAEIRARFAGLITATIRDVLRDQANQRLKDAIERPPLPVATSGRVMENPAPDQAVAAEAIKTTEEELEGFRIIKAILRKEVSVQRISLRDAASYCAVLFDDNNRKPIARLYLEGKKKRIGLFDANKVETRKDIEAVDDLYGFADDLLGTLRSYVTPDGVKDKAFKVVEGGLKGAG